MLPIKKYQLIHVPGADIDADAVLIQNLKYVNRKMERQLMPGYLWLNGEAIAFAVILKKGRIHKIEWEAELPRYTKTEVMDYITNLIILTERLGK